MNPDLQVILRNILDDVRVELNDEFDRNFERQAFFSEAWQRRRSPVSGSRSGHLLVDTGRLRRSIISRIEGGSITFLSTEPYAALHNEGGSIKVTRKMKKFFWHKFYETTGAFSRAKGQGASGARSKEQGARGKEKCPQNTKHSTLNTQQSKTSPEAAFWKWMALKKEGSEIKIPRRRFIGYSPEVQRSVREIIEENLQQFFDTYNIINPQP